MQETVFLNGKFLSSKEAKVSVLAPGFLYGWGLFETMRAYQNKIVYFTQHLKRIEKSSKLLKIKFPYTLMRLKEIIQATLKLNGFVDSYVKLLISKSSKYSDTVVIVKRYKPYSLKRYQQGLAACIWKFRQNADSFLARHKTTGYLFYQSAYLEAKRKGFDEALILNNRGYISEASHSNIFLVKGGHLFTPSLGCGCLEGITRRAILDLAKRYEVKVSEGKFSPADLYSCDEAFLTNSLMGVMPLASLEGKHIGKDRCAKLTKFFIAKYRCLLR